MIAAYDAPYPSPESKAGARAFPLILPTEPDAPGAAAGKRVADALRVRRAPRAGALGRLRPGPPLLLAERLRSGVNFPPPRAIENTSHFLQEDAGEEIGKIIAGWLGDLG